MLLFLKRRNHKRGLIVVLMVGLLVVVMVAVVMVAGFKRVGKVATLIGFQYIFYLAMTASYHADAVSVEFVVGSHAHIACQHEADAHLLHH